jgi:protein TonB
MAKPLRSDNPNPPSVQFRDFGVLNDGSRSKGAAVTSIVLNLSIAALVVILGFVVKTNPAIAKKITEITLPPEPPPAPKPLPKPPPPPPVKLPPTPPTPKIVPPPKDMPPPPDPKPLPTPQPKPIDLPPAPPKKVTPPPAPVHVSLATPAAASVVNHDAHPSAVRLGSPTNPLQPLTGPAVSNVSLGVAGMPGMNKANSGNGPHATAVSMGNGCASCTNINGHDAGSRAVVGVKLGVRGGTGPLNSTNTVGATNVKLGQPPPPAPTAHSEPTLSAANPPKITYKPTPAYTEEAKALHLEGKAKISVVFRANGTMEVLGLVSGLGHGLDESALQAARGIKFRPATDSGGHAIDFPTQIIITFVQVS